VAKKAKKENPNGGFITGAAEMIGGALGTIAGRLSRLRADDPQPAQEAKERRVNSKIPKPAKQAAPKTERGTKVVRRSRQTPVGQRASARRK